MRRFEPVSTLNRAGPRTECEVHWSDTGPKDPRGEREIAWNINVGGVPAAGGLGESGLSLLVFCGLLARPCIEV